MILPGPRKSWNPWIAIEGLLSPGLAVEVLPDSNGQRREPALPPLLMNTRILVTGATGKVGQAFIKAALAAHRPGFVIRGLCHKRQIAPAPGLEVMRGSISDRAAVEAAMAKLAASETAIRATDRSMRVLSGYGMVEESPLERLFRDARLGPFSPISNEMVRNFVAERITLPRSY